MNEHDLLDHELNSLGDDLRTPPSIAPAVLRTIAAGGVASPSAESSTIGPRPRSPQAEMSHATARRLHDRSRSRFLSSTAAVAALFGVVVLGVALLRTDGVAFAQVRERVAAVRTASFSFKHSILLRLPDGQTESREDHRRILVRGDGRVRIEDAQGATTILSPDEFIKLEFDPTTRTATRRYLYESEDQHDLVATLRSLHKSAETTKIPAKEIRGVPCPGFRVEERKSTLLVWVDPRTHLPAHAERSYAKAITGADRDVLRVDETYYDMKFDEPLDDSLFAVQPPAGYAVTTVGTPPTDRKAVFAEPLVVTPNVGAGPLRFGTSRAEIIRLLGKPDSEDIHTPEIPITDKTSEVDGKERPPGASLVVLTKLHLMKYNGLGIWLTVEAVEGLRGIQCLGQDSLGMEGHTFRGATDKGIHVGSSIQDVVKAYGTADKNPSAQILSYRELHLEFVLTERETVRFINLTDSDEHRLRFEWRIEEK